MLRIAGQTAGQSWAELFHGHSWVAGGCYRLKKIIVFPRATRGPAASYYDKTRHSYICVVYSRPNSRTDCATIF